MQTDNKKNVLKRIQCTSSTPLMLPIRTKKAMISTGKHVLPIYTYTHTYVNTPYIYTLKIRILHDIRMFFLPAWRFSHHCAFSFCGMRARSSVVGKCQISSCQMAWKRGRFETKTLRIYTHTDTLNVCTNVDLIVSER